MSDETVVFRAHIERPEGDRLVITVPAGSSDEVGAYVRRTHPGARILKIKRDRSGGPR